MSTQKELFRYCLVTPIVGLTDFGTYYLCLKFLPTSPSKAASFVCAGILGYLLNKFVTFSQKCCTSPEMARYFVVQVSLLGFNVGVNALILFFWPKAVFAALLGTSVLTACVAFVLKKWWVFKPSV